MNAIIWLAVFAACVPLAMLTYAVLGPLPQPRPCAICGSARRFACGCEARAKGVD